MVEGSEIINLVFSLIVLSIFWTLFRRSNARVPVLVDLSLLLLLMSGVFTVAEGFILTSIFNFLEHFFYLISLSFLFTAIWQFGKNN